MSIRQFNARYVAVEDRILLRVVLASGDEFGFWLTRNIMRRYLAAMATWLAPRDTSADAALQAFRREGGATRADFGTPLTPGERRPLGEAPVLVEQIELEDGAIPRLIMRLAGNRNATFNLNDETLAGVHRLLRQAVTAADWGIADSTVVVASTRMH